MTGASRGADRTETGSDRAEAGPDPDGALAQRLAALSPAKRALLERRLNARAVRARPTIPRREPGQPAPLSFAQGRLWFLEQLCPGTNAWNSPVACRLSGPLDTAALTHALEVVVARHATLRTVFAAPGGRPEPILLDDPAVALPVVDLRATPADVREAEGLRLVEHEIRRPFDISADVLVRGRLIRLEDEEHLLVLVAHHIACDGWSKGILLSELCTAYDALSAGSEPVLPELELDYGDYATWQRQQMAGPERERLVTYWRQALDPRPPALRLPADHPRPPRPALQGAIESLSVSSQVLERLDALGQSLGATRFMTILAAFSVMLAAHCDQDDIVIGAPAAMRDHPVLHPLIGFFANTLPYRIDLSGDPSFSEVIVRARRAALGTLAHQDLPFEQIVQASNPRRDASRTPLVQVSLRVEGPEPQLVLQGLRTQLLVIDPGIARFDLAIELGDAAGGLEGYLEYDTTLFEPSTARRLARDFLAILDAATALPTLALTELEPIRLIHTPREPT